jgi:hypothetical protein
MQRYATDLVVGVDDFRNSGWRAALIASKGKGYVGMWEALSDAAQSATQAGNVSVAKVLWLLSNACSMMLTPSSANEPFKPLMVMNGNRTSLPDDFTESDIEFFSVIVDEIDDAWLKARLGDLIWVVKKAPRSPKHALMAIDAYRKTPLDAETWFRGGDECWERAISLTQMLRTGAGHRMKEIEQELIAAFQAATGEDGFLAVRLADLLAKKLLALGNAADIAAKLESLARSFDGQGDLHRGREYSLAAAFWFQQSGNVEKATDMKVFVAEGWVKEAVARASSDQPSHAVAAGFYEEAIKIYRSIPQMERVGRQIDVRIAELQRNMNEEGERSMNEMKSFSSDPIDITQLVETARDAVRGKSALDALAAFANIYPGERVAELRKTSEKMLKEYPIQALVTVISKSADGRVIAKRPGMKPGDTSSEDYQAVLLAEMEKYYVMELQLVVQGYIWPALEVMVLEHRLREGDFFSIATNSPIVPPGRERLFAKALFAGYEKDFAVSLHLLVPQVEHLVRYHLKAAGAKTTTLSDDGIEMENALGTLVDLPETTKIFGEDVTFELKALLCDPRGPNLRNEVAHGLLDDGAFQSAHAVYAWWFGLKLAFNTFWNARRKADVETDTGESDGTA